MITQYEISPLLKEEIPQLPVNVYPARISLEVYISMNYFSDYTRNAIEQHDFNVAKKCFALAERLYLQGDRVVRLLIENIFVHGFSGLLFNNKVEIKVVKSMIPPVLYSLYVRQVVQPGS
jgi:hypothetical protein